MDTLHTSRELEESLSSALVDLSTDHRTTQDCWGNGFLWIALKHADDLPKAAELLAQYKARLCTVTAYNREMGETVMIVAYHFDVHGYTVTVNAPLDPVENSVPTITPWFRNADWNEREFAELYDVHVEGNVNPDRLFLDDDIDEGILNEVVPLTMMMNGACTTDMWERVMGSKKQGMKA